MLLSQVTLRVCVQVRVQQQGQIPTRTQYLHTRDDARRRLVILAGITL